MSESWDNTGLLLGDPMGKVERLMTCLTLTPQSVAEALDSRAQMVVAHHPLPFKAISKITTSSLTGRLLWQLARAGISVYSAHTAWDSAACGINARLAAMLELQSCRPIVPLTVATEKAAEQGIAETTLPSSRGDGDAMPLLGSTAPAGGVESWNIGAGRMGTLPQELSLAELTERLCRQLVDCRPRGVNSGLPIRHVAIACGSGGSLLGPALARGQCDLFLTGEGTFHTCLEAQAAGISLLMIGHFASERFAMVKLASEMQHGFPLLNVWASTSETDPVTSFARSSNPK